MSATLVPEWTAGHLREHALTSDEHRRAHDAEAKASSELSRAHWEFHQREHEASQTAIDKVEVAVERRFSSVNEFREQLREQSRGFLTRNEYVAAHDPLITRLTELEKYRTTNEGKEKGTAPYQSLIFGVVGAMLSAAGVGIVALLVK